MTGALLFVAGLTLGTFVGFVVARGLSTANGREEATPEDDFSGFGIGSAGPHHHHHR